MMHSRFMHREADTAGGFGVFVFHFQLNNTQGAVTLTRFIMIDLFSRIETFTSIEQKPQKQEIYIWTDVCLEGRYHISAWLGSE